MKFFRKSLLIILLSACLFFMIFYLRIASYRSVDRDIEFLLNDKGLNNITLGENITSLTDSYSGDISFVILPTKKADINSYLLLAKQLKNEGCDVFILSYLMNYFYTKEPLNEVVKDKQYYIISHGNLDRNALEQIKAIPSIKGIILLDGETVDYSNTLYLCSDDMKHNKCTYIKGGSFDGFTNYENKVLNKLKASEQQKETVRLILEFVGGFYEK